MISRPPTPSFSTPELKSANETGISRHIKTSNEASTMFSSCKTYKRKSDSKISHDNSLDLGTKMSNIPLFPGRKRSKSKMKQKRFEHKNTSNRKLPLVLLDAQGTIGKNKFSSSKLSRRTSLVQRTHSPIFFNISKTADSSNNKTSTTTSEGNMCSTIPHSGPGLDNRATDRKRKNSFDTYESSLICPTVKRTNVANHDISSIPCYDNDSGAINNSTFDIRIISPTHKGISEAARIMRVRSSSSAISGIVSIPTETHYSLLRFVPFQKPTSSSTRTGQDTCRQAWDTMSSIRSMEPTGAPPSVYLYHPIGAYNFVAFSCRKSFVYRQRSSSSDSEKSAKSTSSTETTHIKITFSESHEVLNRLSSAFWPGTVTIFAPVRTRRLKNRDEQGRTITRINGHDSMESLSSITSLSSEENEDSSPDIVQLASPSVPVVPDSFLCSERELHIPDGGDKKNFIGMRCPSHPIARKILSEAYAQDDGNLAIPLTGAIVGVNAPTSENTCKGVYSTLQSCVSDPDATEDKKPIIHIMNGEDRHEMFSVPPCQFGELPSVSLVLDTPRRNIILLRNNRTDPASNKIPAAAFNFDIRAQEVRRALCNLSKNSVEARAIAAVMSKWRVTEIQL